MAKPNLDLICGKFQLTTSDKFEEFMGALGVSYVVRKLANKSSPVITIKHDPSADNFSIKSESLVKTSEMTFKLGQQFDELTADGRKVKTTMSMVNPTSMKHEMLGTNGGKDSACVRDFLKDGLTCTCTVDDIVTVRQYKRLDK